MRNYTNLELAQIIGNCNYTEDVMECCSRIKNCNPEAKQEELEFVQKICCKRIKFLVNQ